MMRMPLADTRKLTKRSSDSSQQRCVCRFGRNRRRRLLLACDTVLPTIGFLPVTWQTLEMGKTGKRYSRKGADHSGPADRNQYCQWRLARVNRYWECNFVVIMHIITRWKRRPA